MVLGGDPQNDLRSRRGPGPLVGGHVVSLGLWKVEHLRPRPEPQCTEGGAGPLGLGGEDPLGLEGASVGVLGSWSGSSQKHKFRHVCVVDPCLFTVINELLF